MDNTRKMKRLLLLLSLLFTSLILSQSRVDTLMSNAQGDINELGHYPVKNISHEEYQAHHQNWSITQDKNGFIYAGNGDGILEFDGASWRLITSPGLSTVRAVVADENNVKWVGGDRELGYLEPDSQGALQYVSLKDKIPESNPLTANIWKIFADNGRIIFAADNALYSWKNGKFTIIPHPGLGPPGHPPGRRSRSPNLGAGRGEGKARGRPQTVVTGQTNRG